MIDARHGSQVRTRVVDERTGLTKTVLPSTLTRLADAVASGRLESARTRLLSWLLTPEELLSTTGYSRGKRARAEARARHVERFTTLYREVTLRHQTDDTIADLTRTGVAAFERLLPP